MNRFVFEIPQRVSPNVPCSPGCYGGVHVRLNHSPLFIERIEAPDRDCLIGGHIWLARSLHRQMHLKDGVQRVGIKGVSVIMRHEGICGWTCLPVTKLPEIRGVLSSKLVCIRNIKVYRQVMEGIGPGGNHRKHLARIASHHFYLSLPAVTVLVQRGSRDLNQPLARLPGKVEIP